MHSHIDRILVLFVEPMLYNMDIIHEVYEKTEYEFRYIYCDTGLTGKDELKLPKNSFVCSGDAGSRKRQIRTQVGEFDPDFVVVNGYVGVEQTALIRNCQKKRIPYAIESDTQLNIPSNPIKAILKKIYLKKRLHNDLCYGFPGGTLQKENLVYYGIPEERNFIMPMCVSEKRLLDEREKLPSKDELKKELGLANKYKYLFVGRLEEVKNVRLLLEAFAEVKQKTNDVSLLIVGDGSLKNELEQYAYDHQIRDVVFAGYIVFPEIIKYYKVSDAFVLPSSYEPWGLVVNEAMTLDLPVIVSSDVGCRADLLEEGKNGFVFESGQKQDLVKKMESIKTDNDHKMSLAAKKKIAEWNLTYYLECFLGAIKNAEKAWY